MLQYRIHHAQPQASIKRVQENRICLGLNVKHQLLLYADDINMLGENLQIIRENTKIFIKASKDISLEVISKKTKYMITSRHKNIVQNQNIEIGNLLFENVEKFRYLGVMVTNKNDLNSSFYST